LLAQALQKKTVIEESTVKRSTAPNELPAFEFKYRLSKFNRHEYMLLKDGIFTLPFAYPFEWYVWQTGYMSIQCVKC
jgi:hypothetical protein